MIYDAHNQASYKLYEWLASSDHVMEIRVNDSILKIQLLTLTDHFRSDKQNFLTAQWKINTQTRAHASAQNNTFLMHTLISVHNN